MSAIIHSEYPLPTHPAPESLPAMIWSTNYSRLISQTVWTLFFAGRAYAPKCVIDGVNIQDWLQSHFIDAFGLLADRIRDAGDLLDDCVFAWDSINEPGEGFLGMVTLNEVPKHQALKKGPTPSAIQSLRLGTGVPQTVDNWEFGSMGPRRNGSVTIDPAGRSVWSDPSTEVDGVHPRWGWKRAQSWPLGQCIWALHRVWDPLSGNALLPAYFATTRPDPMTEERREPGTPVDFVPDFWRPFWRRYAKRIRASHPEAVLFIQPPVFVQPPPLEDDDTKGRAAYSAHYYDGRQTSLCALKCALTGVPRSNSDDTPLELVQRRRAGSFAREVQDVYWCRTIRNRRDTAVAERSAGHVEGGCIHHGSVPNPDRRDWRAYGDGWQA